LFSDEDGQLTAKMLQKTVKPLKDVPWGVALEESKETAEALEEAGADFIILSPLTALNTMPKNEKTGKVLQIESTMDDGLLRAVNDLPADAVLAADSFGESNTLVWHHLMLLRYLALLISKPLIVPVPKTISRDELKALWDAGIEAVLVPVDPVNGEDLKELHEIAAKLPKRALKKQEKMNVFLSHPGEAKEEPPPEDDD
jgi:hypothetical protein